MKKHPVKMLFIATAALYLSACGGSGNGDDPMAQPDAFVPDGVQTVTLQFMQPMAPGTQPVNIQLTDIVASKAEDSPTKWLANVSSGTFIVYGNDGHTGQQFKLCGQVHIEAPKDRYGDYVLNWDQGDTASVDSIGTAHYEITDMHLHFTGGQENEKGGSRMAVIKHASAACLKLNPAAGTAPADPFEIDCRSTFPVTIAEVWGDRLPEGSKDSELPPCSPQQ